MFCACYGGLRSSESQVAVQWYALCGAVRNSECQWSGHDVPAAHRYDGSNPVDALGTGHRPRTAIFKGV